jgi:hypothetical protein
MAARSDSASRPPPPDGGDQPDGPGKPGRASSIGQATTDCFAERDRIGIARFTYPGLQRSNRGPPNGLTYGFEQIVW